MTFNQKTKGLGIGAWTPQKVGEALVGAGAAKGAAKLGRVYTNLAKETARQARAGVELAQQKLQERELSRIKTERERSKFRSQGVPERAIRAAEKATQGRYSKMKKSR